MANFDDLFTAPTATETQSDRPQLTKEEYAAKKKAERDSLYALADEMAQEVLRDGEAFRGFLDVQARFDRYSATNALLIYAQNDEATRTLTAGKNAASMSAKTKQAFPFWKPGTAM